MQPGRQRYSCYVNGWDNDPLHKVETRGECGRGERDKGGVTVGQSLEQLGCGNTSIRHMQNYSHVYIQSQSHLRASSREGYIYNYHAISIDDTYLEPQDWPTFNVYWPSLNRYIYSYTCALYRFLNNRFTACTKFRAGRHAHSVWLVNGHSRLTIRVNAPAKCIPHRKHKRHPLCIRLT